MVCGVATEGDEVVVAFLLVALEAERHGLILGYRVRASARMPTSQNRDMGHPILWCQFRCGPPAPDYVSTLCRKREEWGTGLLGQPVIDFERGFSTDRFHETALPHERLHPENSDEIHFLPEGHRNSLMRLQWLPRHLLALSCMPQ
jgi:hypothetical protein